MKKLNLVGQTFGRLKVLEEDNKREGDGGLIPPTL